MNRLLKAAAALLCVFGFTIAQAQTTTITASSISMGGVPIAAGTVTFTPVNASGIAIPFATGGGGLNSPTAFSCTIASGAITGSCSIPDAALTTPANILYSVQITNTGTQKSFTMQQVANITGSTWALDHYGPPAQTTNVQPVQGGYGTAAPPSSCVSPSTYTQNASGGKFFTCVGGVFVQISGAGAGAYTANSLGSLYGFGDSTMAGSLGPSAAGNSAFALLARDYPGQALNFGSGALFMSDIVNTVFSNFHTTSNQISVPVVYENGGINDANAIGASTGSINNYTLQLNASAYWVGLPMANKTMASFATASGFTAGYTGPTINWMNGSALQSTTNGDTLTFTGNAVGGKLGLTYVSQLSGTGTFTVSVNGVLQTDMCSGTTTFSAFGCNSQAVSKTTFSRQEFSVTQGAAYTLVVTVTGTTGASNAVGIVDVDTTPVSKTGLAAFVMSGVLRQYLDAKSTVTAAFNTAAQAVTAQAVSDNLNAYFVDVRTGTPGVNTTTDMAASSLACPASASNTPLHPNDCGYADLAQTVENTAQGLFSASTGSKRSSFFAPPTSSLFQNSTNLGYNSWNSNAVNITPTISWWAPVYCSYSPSLHIDCTGINWSATQSTFTNGLFSQGTVAVQHCTSYMNPASCTDSAYWDISGNQHNLGSIQIGSTVAPTCAVGTRGQLQYTAGAAGVKDTVEVCTKNASDVYAWTVIF